MDEWLGDRWDLTIFPPSIVLFGCETPVSTTKGRKIKDIHNELLKVKIKEEGIDIRGIVIYWNPGKT